MKKGNLFEKQVVEYLQAMGFPKARRGGQQGTKDKGDVLDLGLPVTLELKNCATLSLGTWMNELQDEMIHNHTAIGAVVHKRKGKGDMALQYVTMDLISFTILLNYVARAVESK